MDVQIITNPFGPSAPAAVHELAGYFRRFSYKPRFSMRLVYENVDHDYGQVRCVLMGQVLDSRYPSALEVPYIEVMYLQTMSLRLLQVTDDLDAFGLRFMKMLITGFEHHEIDEWLRLDSEQLHAPHSPKVTAP